MTFGTRLVAGAWENLLLIGKGGAPAKGLVWEGTVGALVRHFIVVANFIILVYAL